MITLSVRVHQDEETQYRQTEMLRYTTVPRNLEGTLHRGIFEFIVKFETWFL